MITQDLMAEVLDSQNELWAGKDAGVQRDRLSDIKLHEGFATIITGIRRCGKSTLMRQLLPLAGGKTVFLNFEAPRLAGFEKDDFRRLDRELKRRKARAVFFDEIQMLADWELYVR